MEVGVLEIIQDILGSFLRGKPGLVDIHPKSLKVSAFLAKQVGAYYCSMVLCWFLERKVRVIESSMLSSVQESARLGSPPEPFYTNEISINRVIKQKTGYKSSERPEFCTLAKELIVDQQSEMEKAVTGVGEYLFSEEFKHLEIPLGKWSSMIKMQQQTICRELRHCHYNTLNSFF